MPVFIWGGQPARDLRIGSWPLRALLCVAALGALLATPCAFAGLKQVPDRAVNLSGSWQLDVAKSDDAEAVRAKLRAAMAKLRDNSGGYARRSAGGGFPGHRGGGGGYPGQGGAQPPDGATGDQQAADAAERPTREDNEADAEHNNEQNARAHSVFADALRNPAQLQIEQRAAEFRITAGEDDTSCEPGETVAVVDRIGTAQRSCGWQGQTFVVQLVRQNSGGKLEERFDLSADGHTLTYTTILNAKQIPEQKLRRVYAVAPAGVVNDSKAAHGAADSAHSPPTTE
ncbi:MAG TPA: hypothetical protein VF315_08690 [Steroidobacteraceae bacterium]